MSWIVGGDFGCCHKHATSVGRFYAHSPAAKDISTTAKGILVFPNVYKAGFIIGGQFGDGAFRKESKTVGYYRTVAAS